MLILLIFGQFLHAILLQCLGHANQADFVQFEKSKKEEIAIYASNLQKIECIKGILMNFHFIKEIETFWKSF